MPKQVKGTKRAGDKQKTQLIGYCDLNGVLWIRGTIKTQPGTGGIYAVSQG